MIKVQESFADTADYFTYRLFLLIDEVYNLDNSVNISGDIYVKKLSEKLCRYLKAR